MNRTRLIAAIGAAGIAIGASGQAWATTGYFSHGYSIIQKGLAGAGVAKAQDAMAPALNPAGLVFVPDQLNIGASLFSPIRKYEVGGQPSGQPGSFPLAPGSQDSGANFFLIPGLAYSSKIDEKSSWGIALYGNGGMNTDYSKNVPCLPALAPAPPGQNPFAGARGTFCGGSAGVDLMQMFITPTYSRKINDTASWGITPVLAVQRFKAKGLGAFGLIGFSKHPRKLTSNKASYSYGAGLKLGIQGEVVPGVSLGAAYQSRIYMTDFDEYKGLFAEGGSFDIPPELTVGLAWDINNAMSLFLDYQRIWYGDVDAISNPLNAQELGMAAQTRTTDLLLGGSKGPGFGWDDINIYRIGFQWQSSPKWTWRVGYAYNDQPVPDSEVTFNILAPGIIKQHVTFGFSRQLENDSQLDVSLLYAPEETVSGRNAFDPSQSVKIKMRQYELGVNYTKRF